MKAPLTGLAPRGPAIESPLTGKARPRRVIVGREQRHRVEQDAETTAVVNRPAELDRRAGLIDREREIELVVVRPTWSQLDVPLRIAVIEVARGDALAVYQRRDLQRDIWRDANAPERQREDVVALPGSRVERECELRARPFSPDAPFVRVRPSVREATEVAQIRHAERLADPNV